MDRRGQFPCHLTSYALLDDKTVAVQCRRADLRSVMTPTAAHTAEITARCCGSSQTNQRTLRITCRFSACLPALLLAPLINRLSLQPFEKHRLFCLSLTFFLSFFLSVLASLNSSNHPLWVQRAIVAPDHSDMHTLGRTPLDEGLARRRGLYLTTTKHRRQTTMPTEIIWNRNPSKRTAADRRLRPRGHHQWHSCTCH
jgi:hypothetical protein